jgi:hypothetical protein
MEREAEAITWRTLAGFSALAVLIGIVAAPVALWIGGAGRVIVIRLAVALFCAVVCARLVRGLRARANIGEPSDLDRASVPRAEPAVLDPLLRRVLADLPIGWRWRPVPARLRERLRQVSLLRTGHIAAPLMVREGQRLTWRDAERAIAAIERGP